MSRSSALVPREALGRPAVALAGERLRRGCCCCVSAARGRESGLRLAHAHRRERGSTRRRRLLFAAQPAASVRTDLSASSGWLVTAAGLAQGWQSGRSAAEANAPRLKDENGSKAEGQRGRGRRRARGTSLGARSNRGGSGRVAGGRRNRGRAASRSSSSRDNVQAARRQGRGRAACMLSGAKGQQRGGGSRLAVSARSGFSIATRSRAGTGLGGGGPSARAPLLGRA